MMTSTIRVLYVDDEPDLLEIGKLFLEQQGQFSVEIITSAQTALTLLNSRNYDTIISDYQMPGMDGIEFLKRVRALGNLIPFILFTGRGREEVIIQALNEGADFYLQKGGEPGAQFAELSHKVRQAVQQRQAVAMIRDHERREADIINFLPDATFAIDSDGLVIAWNRAMEEMTGVRAAEILGKGKYEYSIPFYNKRLPILIDLILHDDPFIAAKYPSMKRDGQTLIAEATSPYLYNGRGATIWFTAAPLYNNQGEVVGAIESIRDISDRKRTEEKVQESSERYQSLITVSNTGAWEYHRDRDYLWFSLEYFLMLGRDAREFDSSGAANLKETWIDLLHPDDRNRAIEQFTRYLDSGSPGIYENHFRMQHANGHWVWIWSRGWTLRDKNGALTNKTIGTHIDVTESKRTEEARRINNEHLRLAQEIGQTGSWELDFATGRIWGSEEAFRIFAIPRPADGIIPLEAVEARIPDRERVHRALTDLLETGAEYNIEYAIELADNSGRKIVHSVARILTDAEKKPVRIVGVTQDVTGRKMAEEALRTSEEQYRAILQTTKDGFWMIDLSNGKITEVNETYCRMVGYTRAEILNLKISDLDASLNPDEQAAQIKKIITQGSGIFETRHRRKDGSIFDVELSVTYRNTNGDELICFCRDITGRKVAEEALRVSEGQKTAILNGITTNIAFVDKDLEIIWANKFAAESVNKSPAEMAGNTCHALWADPARPCENCPTLKVFETKQSAHIIQHTPDGRIWNERGEPVFDANGNLIGVVEIAEDITERKKTEEALIESERTFRVHIENSFDVIFTLDAEGKFIFVSPAWERHFGIPVSNVIGKFFAPFVHSDDVAPLVEYLKRVLITGQSETSPAYRVRHANGRWIWFVANGTPYVNTKGERQFVGVGHDITKRKQIEEQVLLAKEEWERTFDAVPDLISILDNQHTIRRVNRAMAEKLGVTQEEAVGLTCYQCVHGTQNPPDFCPHVMLLKDQKEHTVEIHEDRLGGDFLVTCTPLLDKGGQLLGSVHIARDITERKKAEEALKVSEERFRNVIDATGEYVFEINAHGVITFISDRVKDILGYEPQEMIGKTPFDFMISSEEVARVSAIFGEYIRNKLPIRRMEHNCLSKDGRELMLTVTALPILDAAGEIKCYQGTVEDITDRKVAEENIKQQTDAMEAAIDGLAILNADQNYVYMNKAHAGIYGYENARELIGTSWRVLYDSDELQRFEQEIMPELGKKGYYQGRATGKKKNGSTFLQEISLTALEDGKLICVVRDITERKLAEEQLKESEERYRSLYVDSRDAIMLVSPERGFIAANPATIQLFAFRNEQDFVACSPASLSPDYQPDGVLSTEKSQKMMHLALEKGSNFFEWMHRKSDGTEFPAWILLSRLESGGTQLLQATVRDVSERKRAEEALQLANKKLKLLSGITRHDINNQITVLVGYLRILEKKQPDTTHNEYFQKVASAAQRISSMIQFTREYESIGVNAPVWQDCHTIIDTAVKEAQLGKVVVKNDLSIGMEVFADPLIVKVFYNLMDNALRYGEKITTIRFSMRESGDEHLIVCEDDGGGVVAEEKEKIFERGFGKNTGLGLALSREILSITGITIRETGEPGKGARFEMTVPKGIWRIGSVQ